MTVPVTVRGATLRKKIYHGKHVRVTGHDVGFDASAKIMEISGDTVTLQLLASVTCPYEQLMKQKVVNVLFVVPEDSAYSFAAEVLGYNEQEQILQLKQSMDIERMDRRPHFRLKTSKIVYMATKLSVEALPSENWQQASLLDISRGGASIFSPVMVEVGDWLKVWIPLDEVDHAIESMVRVVRVIEGDAGQIILGVSFEALPLPDQEKILDYILKVWTEKKNQHQPLG